MTDSKIKLSSIGTENYKNFSSKDEEGWSYMSEIELTDLNILIGPNGSGKSNFINTLQFLNNCFSSSDDDSDSNRIDVAGAILGGSNMLDKSVKTPANVKFKYRFAQSPSIPQGLCFDLELYIAKRNAKISISKDYLSNTNDPPLYFYKFHDLNSGKGVVSVMNDDNSGSHFEKLEEIPTDVIGLDSIPSLLVDGKTTLQKTSVYPVAKLLVPSVRKWKFYNANYMNLESIKTSEPKIGPGDTKLSMTGDNLALVVDNLIQQDIDFEERLNNAMKTILPNSRRLRSVRVGLMSINLAWHFDGIEDPFYLNEMSDGTVRMLCWATILLSPSLPSLLVIDEPELGIHVSWMPILAEWIKNASSRTQVIISTHSPDLLDHFTDRTADVICFSSCDSKHSSPTRLSPEVLKSKIDEGWELGDLYRVGDPLVGAWPC